MDFIERWFGVSPDGGDGTLEALIVLGLVTAAAGLIFRRPLRAWLAGMVSAARRAGDR